MALGNRGLGKKKPWKREGVKEPPIGGGHWLLKPTRVLKVKTQNNGTCLARKNIHVGFRWGTPGQEKGKARQSYPKVFPEGGDRLLGEGDHQKAGGKTAMKKKKGGKRYHCG